MDVPERNTVTAATGSGTSLGDEIVPVSQVRELVQGFVDASVTDLDGDRPVS
ncbi:hypothetical protein [Streptomyces olivaceus]|uniref:hypothetical protein n=1 Tax=Streptomyces olivaceus TaxID=47716 RepID=UPI0036A0067D